MAPVISEDEADSRVEEPTQDEQQQEETQQNEKQQQIEEDEEDKQEEQISESKKDDEDNENEDEDLFGDNSDEDDEEKNNEKANDLFGSDDDEEVEFKEDDSEKQEKDRRLGIEGEEGGYSDGEEEVDESNIQRAELSVSRHPQSHELKGETLCFHLPRYLFVDAEPFGPENFENQLSEFNKINTNNKSTKAEVQDSIDFKKLEILNTIRWRYAKTDDEHLYKQTNSKIIEWEDGSMSLRIGNEIFDIRSKTASDEIIAFESGQVLLGSMPLNKTVQVTPASMNSKSHKVLAKVLASDKLKKKGINTIVTREDPGKLQREVEKNIKEIERARRKAAAKLALQEERSGKRSMSPSTASQSNKSRFANIDIAEYDDDEDDEGLYRNSKSRSSKSSRKTTSDGYDEDDGWIVDDEEDEDAGLGEEDMLSEDELDRNAEKLRKLKSKGAEKYNNKRSRDEYEDEDEDDLENELVAMADDDVADEEDEDTSSTNRKKKRVIIDEDEDDY
ncbi:binding protein [[Candida] boidinii]|nr:binding protein [[Candida] boidinii]